VNSKDPKVVNSSDDLVLPDVAHFSGRRFGAAPPIDISQMSRLSLFAQAAVCPDGVAFG
jgi:hypothetical protein